ncbi:pyrroline-5-carboxylate reductase [Dongia mobilis]|uniref:Pyrroline-5-carboxylate reductase n=1 Tax=Dongia mobilis TaxID=578943 RepID=A0A4R6WSH3_9PROT|nr:pyrroline-5-carboxylate reductase [Dongia mobilis]TDQ82431.1 pyrroline-5-carboxylate reductase [Dongia mobilis]
MSKLELPGKLLLVGCGKMGGALLRGWLAQGVAGSDVFVIDPAPKGLDDVVARGVTVYTHYDDIPDGLGPALVLLAVKPQFMDEALEHLEMMAQPGTTFLSIAAGKPVEYFKKSLGMQVHVVRAMPNTPAAVGRGMSVIYRDPAVPANILDLCGQLLAAVGEIAWIEDEALMHQVTAVSGGGPAYTFLLIEALAEAGRVAGLPADLAMRLARATICGSGELARQSPESAADLRQAVMSPKGTTEQAIAVLTAPDGIQPLMNRAIAAATHRSRELAG